MAESMDTGNGGGIGISVQSIYHRDLKVKVPLAKAPFLLISA